MLHNNHESYGRQLELVKYIPGSGERVASVL